MDGHLEPTGTCCNFHCLSSRNAKCRSWLFLGIFRLTSLKKETNTWEQEMPVCRRWGLAVTFRSSRPSSQTAFCSSGTARTSVLPQDDINTKNRLKCTEWIRILAEHMTSAQKVPKATCYYSTKVVKARNSSGSWLQHSLPRGGGRREYQMLDLDKFQWLLKHLDQLERTDKEHWSLVTQNQGDLPPWGDQRLIRVTPTHCHTKQEVLQVLTAWHSASPCSVITPFTWSVLEWEETSGQHMSQEAPINCQPKTSPPCPV